MAPIIIVEMFFQVNIEQIHLHNGVLLICSICMLLVSVLASVKLYEKENFKRSIKGTFFNNDNRKVKVYPALTGSKTPPQNSVEAKKLGGDQLSVKVRLVQLIISGDEQNPH